MDDDGDNEDDGECEMGKIRLPLRGKQANVDN